MRNVVTLSDLPPDLHQWLKDEAKRLTDTTGKKTSMYNVVVLATEEYRAKVESQLAPGREVAHVTN